MKKTVRQQVNEDAKDLTMIVESSAATCAICGRHDFLRYGCCFICGGTVMMGDPRLEGYPRVGGKPPSFAELGTRRVPTDHCPKCEYEISAATAIDGSGAAPEPGDITICFDCGHLLEYTADLGVIEITRASREQLSKDGVLHAVLRAQVRIRERGRLRR